MASIYVNPIEYMLIHLHGAASKNQESISMPAKDVLVDVANYLRDEGYIKDCKVVRPRSNKEFKVVRNRYTQATSKTERERAKTHSASKLVVYLNSAQKGKEIPKIDLAKFLESDNGQEKEIRLYPSNIKSPVGKVDPARDSAINKAVIKVTLNRITKSGTTHGK